MSKKYSNSTTKGRATVIDAACGSTNQRDHKRNVFNEALRHDTIHRLGCGCTEDYTCHVCWLIMERERMDTLGLSGPQPRTPYKKKEET
jgi:hypothetical protein